MSFLCSQLGESNWNRMSETERQRKIFSLKLRERQLRKEGKIDEANALLGKNSLREKQKKTLIQLLGITEFHGLYLPHWYKLLN